MPTVRRYERQVLPQPINEPVAIPDAFGAGIGRAISQTGQALQKTADTMVDIHIERELQKDKAWVRDILNQAAQQDREFMAGQYGRLSADGTNVYDESKKYFEDSRRRWMDRLATPRQQEMFAQAYDPRVNSHLDGAIRHQNKQIEIYDRATKNAFIVQTTNDAVMMRRDSSYVEISLAEVTATTRELYRHMGKEVADSMVLDATGKFHAAIIEADLEDDPQAAKRYFDKTIVQTQISEKLKAVLKQKIDRADLRGREQERADYIISASDDPVERLRMARESNKDIRDGAVVRIKARNAEEERFKEKARIKANADRVNRIINAGNYSDALDIADTAQYGPDRLDLIRLSQSLYTGKKIQTDPAKMLEARIRIDREEIPSLETLWMEYKPYADDADWKQLENYFRSGGAAGGLKDATVRTMFKNMTGKSAEEKPDHYQGVWNYVLRNLPEGKKPIDPDVRQLVGQALAEGEREGGGWGYGEDMPYLEAVEKGHGDTWLPDVTGDEEEKITRILKENGKLVTDRTIQLYKKHVILGIPLPAGPLEVQ